MAAAGEAASSEEKQLPNKRETVIWKPRKEYSVKSIPDGKSEESESASASPSEDDASGSPDDDWYHMNSELDVWDGEASHEPEAPRLQDASEYELEDWDKELEESTCSPYGFEGGVVEFTWNSCLSNRILREWHDADDLSCGSFEENNLLGSCVWEEDWFYNPGCHHTPCFVFPPQNRTVESGQFDDADE